MSGGHVSCELRTSGVVGGRGPQVDADRPVYPFGGAEGGACSAYLKRQMEMGALEMGTVEIGPRSS